MTEQCSCLYQLISKFNISQEGDISTKISQNSLSKCVLHFLCAAAPLLLASVVGWTEDNIPSGNVLIPAQDKADKPNLLPEIKNTTRSNYPNKCIRNR